ncbi:putative P4 [Johnsongrass umbra-like virus 1]|nr:putative P4 [Johnsongrass umbra-like virus 1]
MANTTQRGIRLRRRVVRSRRRTQRVASRWRTSGQPFATVTNRRVKNATTIETYLPSSAQLNASAVVAYWPLNAAQCPTLFTSVTEPIWWRITRIHVAMEPATANSTQIVGLGNCHSSVAVVDTSFGKVYKWLRTSNFSKRSTPGGNVQVSWPINMDWIKTGDTYKYSMNVPALVLAVTNPGVIATNANGDRCWVELEFECEFIVAA